MGGWAGQSIWKRFQMASNSCARLMSRAKDAVGENRGSSPRWRAHAAQAEQDVVEARPTVSHPTKARAALAEAEFARDRLQTSHPRDRPRSRQFGTSRMGFELPGARQPNSAASCSGQAPVD